MTKKKSPWRWRTKIFVMLIIFALGPVLGSTYWGMRAQQTSFERSTLAGLRGLATAKSEAIDQFMDYRKRDVERIANLLGPQIVHLREAEQATGEPPEPPANELPDLHDAEQIDPTLPSDSGGSTTVAPNPASAGGTGGDGPSPPPPTAKDKLPKSTTPKGEPETPAEEAEEATARIRKNLGYILWDQKEFEELLIVDSTGRVLLSTFEGHEGHNADSLEYVKNGRKATYLQPVFLSPITNQLTMVIATPIRNEAREAVGVLAARLNLKRFFHLINDVTGLGRTGETVVGKKIDKEVVLMAPTRHDPGAALLRKVTIGANESRALQEASRGQTGEGQTIDYRGQFVFASWQYVPSLDWGLVVKIDYAEAMQVVEESRETTLALTGVIVLLAIAASVVVSQAFVAPLLELQSATQRISRGDFNVALDIRSRDEIGELADSFDRMIAAIKFFREHSRHEEDEPEQAETSQDASEKTE